MTEEEKKVAAGAENEVTKISSSQMSFDSRLDNLDNNRQIADNKVCKVCSLLQAVMGKQKIPAPIYRLMFRFCIFVKTNDYENNSIKYS